MEDKDIINLYWQRNQTAIDETAIKYGGYCNTIANNILNSREDAEECVNDTYLKAWEHIPPQRPKLLSAFLGKLTRNLAIDRLRHKTADKRGSGEIYLVLDELSECVSGKESVEDEHSKKLLIEDINSFLNSVSKEKSNIFLLRYWYANSVRDIAKIYGITENNVSVILNRLRKSLKEYLMERGYDL